MKQHLESLERANRTISDATAKVARVNAKEEKYRAAHAAALERAAELRTKAQRAMAFAVVGDGADDDAHELLAEAAGAEKRAADLRSTLDGLATIKSQAESTAADARAERSQSVKAALDQHTQNIVADYEKAAIVLIDLARRAYAVEFIRGTMGDRRAVLNRREFEIPAPVGTKLPVTGQYNDLPCSAWLELHRPSETAQGVTTETELDLLARGPRGLICVPSTAYRSTRKGRNRHARPSRS